jgi:hypothetical protein
MKKLILRFSNKKLTAEERNDVVNTFANSNLICVDNELELWQLDSYTGEVTKIF